MLAIQWARVADSLTNSAPSQRRRTLMRHSPGETQVQKLAAASVLLLFVCVLHAQAQEYPQCTRSSPPDQLCFCLADGQIEVPYMCGSPRAQATATVKSYAPRTIKLDQLGATQQNAEPARTSSLDQTATRGEEAGILVSVYSSFIARARAVML
jgi:hypothetical protein